MLSEVVDNEPDHATMLAWLKKIGEDRSAQIPTLIDRKELETLLNSKEKS